MLPFKSVVKRDGSVVEFTPEDYQRHLSRRCGGWRQGQTHR